MNIKKEDLKKYLSELEEIIPVRTIVEVRETDIRPKVVGKITEWAIIDDGIYARILEENSKNVYYNIKYSNIV